MAGLHASLRALQRSRRSLAQEMAQSRRAGHNHKFPPGAVPGHNHCGQATCAERGLLPQETSLSHRHSLAGACKGAEELAVEEQPHALHEEQPHALHSSLHEIAASRDQGQWPANTRSQGALRREPGEARVCQVPETLGAEDASLGHGPVRDPAGAPEATPAADLESALEWAGHDWSGGRAGRKGCQTRRGHVVVGLDSVDRDCVRPPGGSVIGRITHAPESEPGLADIRDRDCAGGSVTRRITHAQETEPGLADIRDRDCVRAPGGCVTGRITVAQE
jgi:hypothetical protein